LQGGFKSTSLKGCAAGVSDVGDRKKELQGGKVVRAKGPIAKKRTKKKI